MEYLADYVGGVLDIDKSIGKLVSSPDGASHEPHNRLGAFEKRNFKE
jgi:hypothetical protein